MSKYVSVKTKYYKHSNASGEMGHVDRLFAENVNSFPEYTKDNFGSDFKLLERYNEINAERVKVTGKNVRKDANTYFDAVVVFSLEQFEELERTHPKADLQEKFSMMMHDYMQRMKDEYGFEPIGFKFHLDEGHEKQYEAYQNQQERLKKGLVSDDEKIIEKSDLVRNIHAHALFYNFDFERKISPWRSLKNKDFERFQDLAALSFEKLGFVRGISKKETKKTGLKRDDFINKKLEEREQELNNLDALVEEKKADLQYFSEQTEIVKKEHSKLTDDIENLQIDKSTLNRTIKGIFEKFNQKLGALVKCFLLNQSDSVPEHIKHVQDVIDKSYDDFEEVELGDGLVSTANAVIEPHSGDKPFYKKDTKIK